MPNWTDALLEIRGEPEDIDELLAACRTDAEPFCFSAFHPMPAEMLDTDFALGISVLRNPDALLGDLRARLGTQHCSIAIGIALDNFDGDAGALTGQDLLGLLSPDERAAWEYAKALEDKYGHHTERGWVRANWGTKWDIEGAEIDQPRPGLAIISFETADTEPAEAMIKLSEMFPEIEMEAYCHDESNGWVWGFAAYGGRHAETDDSALVDLQAHLFFNRQIEPDDGGYYIEGELPDRAEPEWLPDGGLWSAEAAQKRFEVRSALLDGRGDDVDFSDMSALEIGPLHQSFNLAAAEYKAHFLRALRAAGHESLIEPLAGDDVLARVLTEAPAKDLIDFLEALTPALRERVGLVIDAMNEMPPNGDMAIAHIARAHSGARLARAPRRPRL